MPGAEGAKGVDPEEGEPASTILKLNQRAKVESHRARSSVYPVWEQMKA